MPDTKVWFESRDFSPWRYGVLPVLRGRAFITGGLLVLSLLSHATTCHAQQVQSAQDVAAPFQPSRRCRTIRCRAATFSVGADLMTKPLWASTRCSKLSAGEQSRPRSLFRVRRRSSAVTTVKD